jgi:hypothetical protein
MTRVAQGVSKVAGRKRIVVEFDDEMFEAIRQLAIKEQTSFAEQVRTLCEWGLSEQ